MANPWQEHFVRVRNDVNDARKALRREPEWKSDYGKGFDAALEFVADAMHKPKMPRQPKETDARDAVADAIDSYGG